MASTDLPDHKEAPAAANDNSRIEGADPETLRKVNEVARQLARIIGRRMAREDFARQIAANDNKPLETGNTEGEADKE